MPSRVRRTLTALVMVVAIAGTGAAAAPTSFRSQTPDVAIEEFRPSAQVMDTLRARWGRRLAATHRPGSWAQMKMRLTDSDLALLGLPPSRVLQSQRFDQPTMLDTDGTATVVDLPAVATFAGTGFFGIRPGAFLLIIDAKGTSWCSLAHVVGTADAYSISTAGHCGPVGQRATVIAAFGNVSGTLKPIVLDFGKFSTSVNEGVGNDWALIEIAEPYQHLVTPTMAFWGGPRGTYTKTGSTATVHPNNIGKLPDFSINADPLMAQAIVHYGHGTGLGAGGTPRAGTALHWGASHFMFFGAISPGDSGSGANTLGGDTVGATMESAGIITHRWIDADMDKGLGIMAGTRTTQVQGNVARGQLIGYPAPLPLLP